MVVLVGLFEVVPWQTTVTTFLDSFADTNVGTNELSTAAHVESRTTQVPEIVGPGAAKAPTSFGDEKTDTEHNNPKINSLFTIASLIRDFRFDSPTSTRITDRRASLMQSFSRHRATAGPAVPRTSRVDPEYRERARQLHKENFSLELFKHNEVLPRRI